MTSGGIAFVHLKACVITKMQRKQSVSLGEKKIVGIIEYFFSLAHDYLMNEEKGFKTFTTTQRQRLLFGFTSKCEHVASAYRVQHSQI